MEVGAPADPRTRTLGVAEATKKTRPNPFFPRQEDARCWSHCRATRHDSGERHPSALIHATWPLQERQLDFPPLGIGLRNLHACNDCLGYTNIATMKTVTKDSDASVNQHHENLARCAYTVCNSHVCRTLREPLLIPQRRRRGGQVFRGSGLKGKCRQLQGTTRLRGTSSSTQRSQFTNEYMTPS